MRPSYQPNIKTMLKLFYTPKSHFSRKVRILSDALNLEIDLIDIGNVADNSVELFGENPLMKVPTLVDEEIAVFDSDHIAKYIVAKFDPSDRFDVLTRDVQTLNARSIMNGVMSAEVELILAQRTGIDTTKYQRFTKIKDSIVNGLSWLEDNADIFSTEPSYLGFHLVVMHDHLAHYEFASPECPKLEQKIRQLSSIEFIKQSAP